MPAVVPAQRSHDGTFGITVREDCRIDGHTAGHPPRSDGLRVGDIIVGVEGSIVANKAQLLQSLSLHEAKPVVKIHVAESAEYTNLLEMGFPDLQCRFALTKADTFEAAMMVLFDQECPDAAAATAATTSVPTQQQVSVSATEILEEARIHRSASEQALRDSAAESMVHAVLESALEATHQEIEQEVQQLANTGSGSPAQIPSVPSPPLAGPDESWVDADPVLSASNSWEQKEQYRAQVEPLFGELFSKYAVLGAGGGMRTEDVRKCINLLFRKYGLAEFDRTFMSGSEPPLEVSKDSFIDFVFRESLVPASAVERDELKSKLQDVPNWPLVKYKVVSNARVRSTPELGGGAVLSLLQPGEEITAQQILTVQHRRRRVGFVLNGQLAWTSELSKDGRKLLEEIISEKLPLEIDDVDDLPSRPSWSIPDGGLALTSSKAQVFGAVYENQRRRLGLLRPDAYIAGNLGWVDPPAFSGETGDPKEKAVLPSGWEWKIDIISGKTDKEGWQYAFAFQRPSWSNHHKNGATGTWVRRRKWVPVLQQVVQRSALDQLPVAEILPAGSGVVVVEVFGARHLPLDSEGVAPDAVAAVSLLDQSGSSFTTASRPATQNPIWHDPSNSHNCRFIFNITVADVERHRALLAKMAKRDFVVVDDRGPSQLHVEVQNSRPGCWIDQRAGKDAVDGAGSRPQATLGSVSIPLDTILSHRACDGWHNLQNGEGELRVCWLLLSPHYAPRHDRLPSPSQYLANKAHDKELRTSLVLSTSEEPAAELETNDSDSDTFSPHVRSGRYVRSEAGSDQWDSEMLWSEWRGKVVGSSFLDEHGFLVPLGHAHDWQVAHSHWMCLQHRSRNRWQDVIMTAAQHNVSIADVVHSLSMTDGNNSDIRQLLRQYGVPNELRKKIWPALAGGEKLATSAQKLQPGFYADLVQQYEMLPDSGDRIKDQIRLDLHRTMSHQHTAMNTPKGLAALERVLGAYAMYNPRVGYCQSMNFVAGHLLCQLSKEQDVFWTLVKIAEKHVPEFWGPDMDGLQASAFALKKLGETAPSWAKDPNEGKKLARTLAKFEESMVPMGLVAAHWLLPLFSMTLPSNTLYRLWDLFVLDGHRVLVGAALTMMLGIEPDALGDFESAMEVLQHGVENYFDATPFIEKTMQFTEQIDRDEFDCMLTEYLETTKLHNKLVVQCPIVKKMIAANGGVLQQHSWLTQRDVDMLSKPFFDLWQQKTSMSAVPGADPYMCALDQGDVAQRLLPHFLPGLRSPRFSYLAQRLSAAAASSGIASMSDHLGTQQRQVTLAQFVELFDAMGDRGRSDLASSTKKLEVCFRAFDLDEDSKLSPSEVTTVTLRFAAMLRGVCPNGGPAPEHVLEANEAAATLIGNGSHSGQLSLGDFIAAMQASSAALLVDVRDLFCLESAALLGLAL